MNVQQDITSISLDDYLDPKNATRGYCVFCNAFTNTEVDAHARRNRCDVCDHPTVYGIEQLQTMGLVG